MRRELGDVNTGQLGWRQFTKFHSTCMYTYFIVPSICTSVSVRESSLHAPLVMRAECFTSIATSSNRFFSCTVWICILGIQRTFVSSARSDNLWCDSDWCVPHSTHCILVESSRECRPHSKVYPHDRVPNNLRQPIQLAVMLAHSINETWSMFYTNGRVDAKHATAPVRMARRNTWSNHNCWAWDGICDKDCVEYDISSLPPAITCFRLAPPRHTWRWGSVRTTHRCMLVRSVRWFISRKHNATIH